MTADLHPDTGQPRPDTCCGKCPPIAGSGWDCTCEGNPRCRAAGAPRVGDTITTVEQLDVLRPGTVALDRHGYPWRKGTGSWVSTSDGGVIEPHEAAPLTVLYVPGALPFPSVTVDARAERPLRCDGTPHPEAAIPPLSEHDYRFDGDDPYVVCGRCGERRDALTGNVRAAGRAGTRSVSHVGRSFHGTRLEDDCPCPKGACGLAIHDGTVRGCDQHDLRAAKTIRQMHVAADCPAAGRAETTTQATERIAREIATKTAMTGVSAREYVEAIQALQHDQLDPADVWDQGYTSGHSNAMRQMSDEPNAPTTPNPYRGGERS